MYKFLTKNGQSLALGLGVLVIAIFLISAISGFSALPDGMSTDLNKLTKAEKGDINFFNPGLALTIVMIGISFVLAFLVFGIIDLIKFPKNAIKFAIGGVVLLLVFYALYATSTYDTGGRLEKLNETFSITEPISKFISGGIKTTLGLLGLAVVGVILGEIWSLFK